MIAKISCKKNLNWLSQSLADIEKLGFAIIENILDPSLLEWTRRSLYEVQKKIATDIGVERLTAAGERGQFRMMMKYEEGFTRFLELPEVLQIVDATVSPTAVLHLQNGFILPSLAPEKRPDIYQNQFHMDFPRVFNGYMTSINTFFAIDDFTHQNGATLLVPSSHQKSPSPELSFLQKNAVSGKCPAGSMIVFDSTLFHCAGINTSGKDRISLNQQFTRSFLKQQMDYCRGLGEEFVLRQKPRTQQLLGWYTRIPTSLDDYYRLPNDRLYRKGQG